MKIFRISVVALTSVLAACGGGGGGGNPSPAVPATFTSFPIPASSAAVLQGDSAQGTYVVNLGTGKITFLTTNSQQPGATCTISVDAGGTLTSLHLTTASGTNLIWTSPADTFAYLPSNTNVLSISSASGQNQILAADPTKFGWSYQTFGVWVTGYGTGSGTYGVVSFGAATPTASVPASGTATYSGATGGSYVDATGTQYYTVSNLTSNADFAARTLSFSTTGTQQGTSPTGVFVANTILDTTGTLAYSAGSNQFTGAVHNTGSTLAGTATGRFYGPAAQEIGGTFSMTGTAGNYVGGFGAKK